MPSIIGNGSSELLGFDKEKTPIKKSKETITPKKRQLRSTTMQKDPISNQMKEISPTKWKSPRRSISDSPNSITNEICKTFESKTAVSSKKNLSTLLETPKWNPKDSEQISTVKAALHFSTAPSAIVCREKEQKLVFDFCKSSIEQERAGSLYVCGCPGTGKTLSLEKVKQLLVKWVKEEGFQMPDMLTLNCTSLTNTREIFTKVLETCQPKRKSGGSSSPLQHLQKLFSEKKNSSDKKMTLIVADELDYMITRDRAVLHDLFMLTTLPYSTCILVGIANAIDLADRFLPKLQSLNCKPTVVPFQAYSKDQILQILQQRLMALPYVVFQPQALELCARKVAAASGDMRKALSVCRSAIEILEAELRDNDAELPAETALLGASTTPANELLVHKDITIVRLHHMAIALSRTFKSGTVDTIQSLPQHQQIILCSAVKLFRGGKKDTTVGEMNRYYSEICKSTLISPAGTLEFTNMCKVLSDQGLLKLGQSREDKLKRVTLKVDEADITFALQNHLNFNFDQEQIRRRETMEIDEEIESGKIKPGEELSIEQLFESKEVPTWTEQLTIRSIVVSFLLGFLFTFIVMKLNVTTGVIPSLNVAAGLLGFFLVKVWISALSKLGIQSKPFTRQENTVIQTCVVATSGIAFSSGYGSYILGMTANVASKEENFLLNNIKPLHILWMLGFLCVVSFVGLFSILPLRKIMILDYKLTYPSGTATAYLINSFHTPKGAKLAKKQVMELFKWFVISFGWAFFQWFYTAADGCGFSAFPTFGLEAYKYRFYFDFSATYVGVGMICPYSINLSMLLGAVLSWGVMWPLIEKQQGIWYPSSLPGSSLKGLQGYKVFIAIAMILGDGLYHFLFVLTKTAVALVKSRKKNILPAAAADSSAIQTSMSYDDERRTKFFLKDQIPTSVAVGGYIILAILAIFAVPALFHELKWYHIIIIYAIAPILAFCNSYGCGLTDWSLASSYGKLAIFIFGAWVGLEKGGVVAGLAACGVMMSIVSVASDLMQDFKTGYLTLASPRSMFFSQVFGTLLGCIMSPFVFWFFFYKAFPDLGLDGGEHPAPYGSLYRGIALIAIEGTSALPKNCLILSLSFFVLAIILNGLRDILKYFGNEYHKYVPSAMAMAIPFYLGGYFTIDMCVGSLIRFLWEKKDKSEADAFVPAMASGMICGDSLWGMPSSILSLAKVNPPLCMKFLSRAANTKVDALLTS